MPDASEWDGSLFRRSLADLEEHPLTDGQALGQFQQYWYQSLVDAEASGALTGVERDVLFADLQATVRGLPGVTVIEFSSSSYLKVTFTKPEH
jgi:hypothetical protein